MDLKSSGETTDLFMYYKISVAIIFYSTNVCLCLQTLRVGWEQLMTSVAKSISEIENQVGYLYTRLIHV